MKSNEGYILLKSLLTTALVLICVAAFYFALASAVRQSGQLKSSLEEELTYRRTKIVERLN